MAFELPKLGYDYAALEPHIDARTMEIHHTKHHQAYVTNLNNAIAGGELENNSLEEILANVSKLPAAVRNNSGGHFNHTLFWTIIAPNAGGAPKGDLLDALNRYFGSFDKFKEQLNNAGIRLGMAGKGWKRIENYFYTKPGQSLDGPVCRTGRYRGSEGYSNSWY
jgi:Fe-Mn family superoxide dismutase